VTELDVVCSVKLTIIYQKNKIYLTADKRKLLTQAWGKESCKVFWGSEKIVRIDLCADTVLFVFVSYCFHALTLHFMHCIQCFDAVGWAA